MFADAYRGRRVLVTGHTGFKGSWLSHWLQRLGAQVAGIALAPATSPALFDALSLARRVEHHVLDIRAADALAGAVAALRPEVVFHLAAQPLVRASYADPKTTWDTNVGGTVNVLEAVRACPGLRAVVVVTTDKCYENREWPWGYRENDALGGHDPYSASKGAAELVVASYRRSFFAAPAGVRLASARAGNVIGGGDWSADRIVTDFITAIGAGRRLTLRRPGATRPWQHVLEPLSGYLALGAQLLGDGGHALAEAWNFGPPDASVVTVAELARRLVEHWGRGEVVADGDGAHHPHEAGLLKLDCSKALARLGWRGVWDLDETVRATAAWYRDFAAGADATALVDGQLDTYAAAAARQKLTWSL